MATVFIESLEKGQYKDPISKIERKAGLSGQSNSTSANLILKEDIPIWQEKEMYVKHISAQKTSLNER